MKLTKAIIGLLSIPAIVVPVTTLTSCGQGWGNATPFAIGGLDASPYAKFNQTTYYDYDGENMINYLQSSYAVQSGNGFYAYSAPMKFTEGTETEPGTWNLGEVGWYTSNDGNLNPTAKDKYKDPDTDSQAVSNAQNAALASNIDFVGTIGNTIGSYLDLALQYQASQLNEDDKEMKDIGYAWGGESFTLNHGKKGGTDIEKAQNNDFIEFILALSNLIGTKAVKALFKTSQVNFTFDASDFPLPSYVGKKAGISSAFYTLINGSNITCKESEYWNNYPNKPEVKTEKTKVEGKDAEFNYRAYEYKNVPVVVNFNSLTKTYVNPRIKNKFLVNDVYSTKDQILSSIDKQWDKIMPKFADPDIRESKTKPMYISYELDGSTNVSFTQGKDTRLPETLHGNDFIALVDYVVYAYDIDGEDIKEDHPERNKAIISGVSDFFPAYFVNLYDDMFVKIKDTSSYVFSKKAVDNHNSDLLGLLNRTSKEGKKPHARDVDHKELLTFLGYLFGSSATTINTSSFFKTTQIK